MAVPTIVGSPSTDSGTGTSASLTKIVGLADGDSVVIVLGLAAGTSPAITWPNSFSLVHSARVDQATSDGYLCVARKHEVTDAAEPATWKVGWSGTFTYQAIAIAIRSGNAADALADDTESSSSQADVALCENPGVNVLDEAMTILVTLGSDDGGTSWGAGGITVNTLGGFTERLNAQIANEESGLWVGTKAVAAGWSGLVRLDAGNVEDWQHWAGSFIDGTSTTIVPGRIAYSRSLKRRPIFSRPMAEVT